MTQPVSPAKPAAASVRAETPGGVLGAGPLRVLLVHPHRSRADWLVRAGQALRLRGHAALLLVLEGSPSADRARELGIDVHKLATPWALDPRNGWTLRRLAGTWRPDATLLPDASACAWLRRIGRNSPAVPSLIVRPAPEESPAPSPGAGIWVSAGEGPAVEVAPGLPVSNEPIPFDWTMLRRALRLSRRHAIVLQLDGLVRDAGHAVTLQALARMRDRAGPARRIPQLAVVGSGPEESDLHVLSHELRLQEHILWIGARKDRQRYLRAADVLVVPASTEQAPGLIVDALTTGVPVVAVDSPAHRALISPGATGLLVEPGDADALAEALAELLGDPARAATLARAARDRAAATWGADRLAAQLEALVAAAVLARRPRRRPRPAVFVDRDGTLVRNVPYNCDPEAVVLEPDAGWVLGRMRAAGCAVVVVSNQSAVARGLCSEEQVRTVNARVVELLRRAGADVDRVEYCPHHPDHGEPCTCRKPEPGMLLRAAADLGLDLAASVTIGDEGRDLEAGARAGTATVAYTGDWLRTGCAALGALWRRSDRDDSSR